VRAAVLMKFKPLRDPSEASITKLSDDPRYKAVAQDLHALEERYRQAENRKRIARARSSGQKPNRPISDRARDLLAGGSVSATSHAGELEAALEEQRILRHAIQEHNEKVAAVKGEISFEICQRFASQNADALRNALEATQALFDSLEANRVLRGRLIGAGFEISEAALPTNAFPSACALGDPDRVGMTPAWVFKTWLKAKGII
jgi:chromatin segregation and condensation protein Rec8/ScpA/Scc1 (kleisin family)